MKKEHELISFSELARRIGKSKPYISKLKKQGRLASAIVDGKIYYQKVFLTISKYNTDRNWTQRMKKEV